MKKKMFDVEKLGKKTKKKSKPQSSKNKRVNFSWLNSRTACRAKAYMAYLADRKKKQYAQIGTKRGFFTQCILPRVLKKFPLLYKEIRAHYHEKGRRLTRDEYIELLYARFVNMYDGHLVPTDEHPKHSSHTALKKAYLRFRSKKKT